jgi:hypothetical protein
MDPNEGDAPTKRGPGKAGYAGAIGVVMFIALVGSIGTHKPAEAPPKQAAGTPSYCKDKAATYRLPECGLSERERREIDQAPERRAADAEAFYRYLGQKAGAICNKPLAQMTMEDVEDCNRPGMRALRGK